jgi:putative nucleotidyltransferase with HDIG domain
VGDEVLRAMADRLYRLMRGSDVPGRYGGDEFVLILPETGMEGAIEFAERLREDMADRPFLTPDGTTVPVFLSCGVATYPDHGRSVAELVSFADANLYVSKQHGGDTITAGPDPQREELGATGLFGVLDGLVTAVDKKDRYTRRHSESATAYALALGREIGLSDADLRALRIAGILHDVGKIGVPDRILRKPGRLTPEEQEVVKQHAALSELIVKEVPHLNEVVGAVGSHHERWDGGGYPRGLKGEETPLLGRILAVADTYAAMTMDRPYRMALTPAAARAELVNAAGTQLDPTLVEAFLLVLDRDELAIAN